ncbi:uncharacterized protein LOC132981513 isoform X2 [Labrus mixtus]|nr:uncharacterized protein LOC132981513 isoform X2 [Labrus mixtus]
MDSTYSTERQPVPLRREEDQQRERHRHPTKKKIVESIKKPLQKFMINLSSKLGLGIRLFSTEQQLLEYTFGKKRDPNEKCDLFNQLISRVDMNQSFERMPTDKPFYTDFIAEIRKNTVDEKQFAFAYIIMKNGEYKFSEKFVPQKKGKRMLHSEELLIEDLKTFLLKNGTNVRMIFIYTYNSPCLKREDNSTSCMILLLNTASQWCAEYGIITYVGFTKFWRFICLMYFLKVKTTDMSSYSSIVHLYKDKHIDERFRLDSSKFTTSCNELQLFQKISTVEPQHRGRLKSDIKSASDKIKEMASSSSRTYDEHLLYRTEQIENLKSTLLIYVQQDVVSMISEILNNSWKEMVENSRDREMNGKINGDFNIAAVKHFQDRVLKPVLGSKSPMRLYHIPKEELEG